MTADDHYRANRGSGRAHRALAIGGHCVSQMGISRARAWAARSEQAARAGHITDGVWVGKDARAVVLATCAEPGGARATAAAVRSTLDYVRYRRLDEAVARFAPTVTSHLASAVRRAHAAVRDAAARDGVAEYPTSLLVALLGDDEVWLSSVGSAHAFLLRGGSLAPLLSDPSERIGRALAGTATLEADATVEELRSGDVLVFCSGALARALSPARAQAVMATASTPTDACQALIRAAHLHGCSEEASAVVVRCFEDSSEPTEPEGPRAA